MTILQTILAAVNWNVRVNENFKAVSPAALFALKDATTSGLTLGYYGGVLDGASYADGTHALTASTTRYVVVARATGAVSSATTTTNWNDTTNYLRMGIAVVGASTFTWTDWRQSYGGAGGGGGSGMTNPMTAVADLIVGGSVTSGVAAPARLAKGSALQVLRVNAAGTALEYAAPGAAPVTAIPIAVGDETTALTTGAAKVTFRMPFAFTLSAVRASLTTVQSAGSILTVDINEGGTTILSSKLTIDNTEKTSTTAAAPAVISDVNLADDAEITIDIDQVGTSGATGLKVYLIGTP